MTSSKEEEAPRITTRPACTHCGAQDHYLKEIPAGGGMSPSLLPLGISGWLEGGRYRLRICGQCGLTQWFVVEAFLDKVRERFEAER